jgi:type VI secretion system protein ImpA
MGAVLGWQVVEPVRLLAPIASDREAGEDLRYTEVYDQIREARREDDPSLPQGVWQTKLKQADWATVGAVCAEALATRSKDLQLAAWLLEARFHLEGLPGVRSGLALLSELCTSYWEGLYPGSPAELEARLAPIHWLNEKFSLRLRHIPVAHPTNDDAQFFTVADWEEAVRRGDKEQKERIGQGAAASTRHFYEELLECVQGTSLEATRLERVLQERCGADGPSLGRLRGQLTAAQQILIAFLAEHHGAADPEAPQPLRLPLPDPPAPGGGSGAPESMDAQNGANGAAPVARFRTREEAYQVLAEIADYLLRVEPHSPTPYLIKRAVAWGRMPLAEVLQELVRDPNDLRAVYSLLGIENGGSP